MIEFLGRDTSIGHYEFAITELDNRKITATNTTAMKNENTTTTNCLVVVDGIFPYPPDQTVTTVNHALEYSCQ